MLGAKDIDPGVEGIKDDDSARCRICQRFLDLHLLPRQSLLPIIAGLN
jgi:hypothetical protein